MAEYTEYSKRRNIWNILKDGIYRILCILLELTKKQRQRMLGCFEILKIQFSYCRLLETFNDGFESHLDK